MSFFSPSPFCCCSINILYSSFLFIYVYTSWKTFPLCILSYIFFQFISFYSVDTVYNPGSCQKLFAGLKTEISAKFMEDLILAAAQLSAIVVQDYFLFISCLLNDKSLLFFLEMILFSLSAWFLFRLLPPAFLNRGGWKILVMHFHTPVLLNVAPPTTVGVGITTCDINVSINSHVA